MTPVQRRAAQLAELMVVQAGLLFGSAGTFGWGGAWLFLGLYVAMLGVAAAVLLPGHREVIAERSRGMRGGFSWDVVFTGLVAVTSLSVLVVAGLARRFGWEPALGPLAMLGGTGLFVVGFGLALWAMATNRFFSQVVRIQSERGHEVVTAGPYRFVRHPGYVGMVVSLGGSVLILGSPWAGIPAVLYVAVVVGRTAMEDAALSNELPGYRDYARRTRYRLVPGVW